MTAPAAGARVRALAAQAELWHLDRAGAAAAMSVGGAWRLCGPLDEAALRTAVAGLVERHESLRSVFHEDDAVLWMSLRPADGCALRTMDAPPEWTGAVEHLVEQLCAEPFDLATGPVARFWLVRLGDREHLLIVNVHHIVADAESLAVIEHDLADLYDRARAARGHEDRPAYSLIQLVEARHRERGTQRWHADLDHWAGVLQPLPEEIPLPLTATTGGGARRTLPGDLDALVEAVRRRHRATPFQVFLATWCALLARWANVRDLVIGVPMAARSDVDVQDAVGFFTVISPIRVTIAGDPTLPELLEQVRTRVYEALDHQTVSLSDILARIRASGDPGPRRLTQVVVTHRGHVGEGLRLPGVEVTPVPVGGADFLYDLAIQIEQSAGRWTVGLEGRRGEDAEMERLWRRYEMMLRAAVAEPDTPMSRWPIVLPSERDHVDGRPAPAPMPPEDIPAAVLAAAQAGPGRVAIIDAEGSVTYWQLLRAAGAVAAELRRAGTAPGEVVAVCVARGRATVAALLGVLFAGAVYLPVDERWPDARMATVLADAAVRRIVVTPSTADRAAFGSLHRVPGWSATGAAPELTRTSGAAYLIYTSGSTGHPKGVLVGHRSLANLVARMRELDGLPAAPRMLAATSPTFDISLVELLLPLVTGGICVIAGDEQWRDPARLAALVQRHRLDCVQATPTMWAALLDHLTVDVAYAICGGEPLEPGLRDRMLRRCGRVLNGYGPTEATVYATTWPAVARERVSVGRPLANVGAWVLDEWDRPCPPGTVGRLLVGGVGVAAGYLDRPELTARAFRDGVPGVTEQRVYETGDRASRGPDGLVYLHGRADDQIKLRGHRIELGEVEAVISAVDGVTACAVVPYEIGANQRGLAAFVVAGPMTLADGGLDPRLAGRIDAAVRAALPDYMRPQLIRRLDAMPRVPAGKVDRAALRELAATVEPAPAATDRPRSPTAEAVGAAWREVLGVPDVPPDASFFALGGDSLGAAWVVRQLVNRMQVDLSLQDFFDAPTIDLLAEVIDERAAARSGRS